MSSENEIKLICITRIHQSVVDGLEPFPIVVACIVLLCSEAGC